MAESPRQVNIINTATITVADTEAGLATGESFSCVVTGSGFVPTANSDEVPATGCAPKSNVAAASSWACEMKWLQDLQSPGGGLSGWAMDHDGTLAWVKVAPTSPALPAMTAQVSVVAGQIYGTFGELLVAEASWPCQAAPSWTPPTAAMAAAE